MGQRTFDVLRLASLEPNAAERLTIHQGLLDAAGEARQVEAKFRDFTRRKFITSEDWTTTQLTAKGRQALESLA